MSELASYFAMRKELWKKYPLKVVALHKAKVIAHGETYKEALEKARRKVGKSKIMLHRVGPLEEGISIL